MLLQDSLETVISRDRQSWEDPTTVEVQETAELPRSISPHESWQGITTTSTAASTATTISPSVILDVDSATDTDSDVGGCDSSEPGYESGEYENSSSNWELEMLVEQMRERRSASLDHNSMARSTMRKRFARSGSADTRRD